MKRSLKILAAVALAAVLLVSAGLWWFFRDDAPAEVSLEAAVESVSDDSTATTTAAAPATGATATTETTATADTATDDGIAGSWSVDTTSGEFDYESATGTFAGFRVEEELSGIGSTTAVGRTGDVSGSITIDGTTVTAATFDVDVSTITTNDSRRDDQVQNALETGTYPTATFTLTEPIELGEAAASGEAVSVSAVGELTIHGVTQPVEIPLEAQLVDGTIVIVGSIDVTFSDYGVEVPSSQIIVSVDDHGVMELQLLLVRS